MRYDGKVLWLEIKGRFAWFCVPVLFLYGILLPFQVNLLEVVGQQGNAARLALFESAQKYIPAFSLWYLFWFMRRVLESEAKEVLYHLDKRSRIRYVFYFYVLYLLCVFPMMVWYQIQFPGSFWDCAALAIQGLLFLLFFYLAGHLLKSALLAFILTFFVNLLLLTAGLPPYHLDKLVSELSGVFIVCNLVFLICVALLGVLMERISVKNGRILA